LLRETLDRLRRQEERTAAIEAALAVTPPPAPCPVSPPAPSTAPSTAAETVVAPWPKRIPPVLRPPRPDVAPSEVETARAKEAAERDELRARLAHAEAVLRDAMNLATAGRVAAGMAHDVHNLLGVIMGNADLLRESLALTDPHRETAEAIARAAQTVAGVSRKVLAIGRPAASQLGSLDAAAAVRSLQPILHRLVGKQIALVLDLAPELPPVRADATEFDRVLLNLVLNARDACTAGGSVTVRAALATVGGKRFVALTVSDTGCGMPPEVRQRMFELFFTTKGERGTGLGLATVRDAVSAVGGHVEVESEVGWGTQVRVYWPVF
jgi:signal transduction histidine kinase